MLILDHTLFFTNMFRKFSRLGLVCVKWLTNERPKCAFLAHPELLLISA